MHRRPTRLATLLIIPLCITTLSTRAAQSESATPEPLTGIEIEHLISTPPLSPLPTDTSVSANRITYQPGATFELVYHGPVIYYVEQGTLAVAYRMDSTMAILQGPQAGTAQIGADGSDLTLAVGSAILAEDGRLGRTRNPGTEALVVLAILLVPESLSGGESESAIATAVAATPAP